MIAKETWGLEVLRYLNPVNCITLHIFGARSCRSLYPSSDEMGGGVSSSQPVPFTFYGQINKLFVR